MLERSSKVQVNPVESRDARRRCEVILAVIARHPVGSVLRVKAEAAYVKQMARRGLWVFPR
jgi:hypothetical protein